MQSAFAVGVNEILSVAIWIFLKVKPGIGLAGIGDFNREGLIRRIGPPKLDVETIDSRKSQWLAAIRFNQVYSFDVEPKASKEKEVISESGAKRMVAFP